MGTDSLGREVEPTVGFEDKYVGIFYFVLMGEMGHDSIYYVSKFLEKYGTGADNPLFDLDSAISPRSNFHYWGEPLYGYYKSSDKWVIRRHLELFMEAGIDFLYIDYSNGITYPASVGALLSVIQEMQAEGLENVPTVVFVCPNSETTSGNQMGSLDTLQYLWDTYYSKSEYDSCWFYGDKELNPYGNPLVVGRFQNVTDQNLLDWLWLKELQWPTKDTDNDAFPWIEWNSASTSQPNHNGIMNVSIAQHVNSWSSTSYTDSLTSGKKYEYRARGFDPTSPNEYGTDTDKVLAGSNFEWQWQNALAVKDDLKMVTITGWNEWVASKITYSSANGVAVFNDCFNMEFSRDAEMMKGGYGDNYYMQIARNIRSFSGVTVSGSDNVALFDRTTISSIADIASLPARFIDIAGDAVARNATAVDASVSYIDNSNRNNILQTCVGNDGTYLYIAVTTKDDITSYTTGDNAWMTLYLDCGQSGGWENYNFVINRAPSLNGNVGITSVEKLTGSDCVASNVGTAQIEVSGNTILYTIPLELLGVTDSNVIGVKATDNLQSFGDIDDFYISGDCAPLGRLNYAYKIA
jgi:hypothetical protein